MKKDLKQILINILSQFANRGVVVVASVLSTIILRRSLGVDGYGGYVYILNFVLLLLSFVDMGTHLTTVREASMQISHKAKLLGNMLILRTTFVIFVSLVGLFIGSIIFPNQLKPTLPFALIFLFALFLKETHAIYFHSQNKLHLSSLIQTFSTLILFISILFVTHFRLPISNIFIFTSIGLSVFVIPFIIFLLQKRAIIVQPHPKQILYLAKQSLPLGLTLIFFTIYSRIDTIIMAKYFTVTEVGIYGLSYKIYDNLILPAAFMLNALLPQFSKSATNNIQSLISSIKKSAIVLFISSIIISTSSIILSPFIINILTGETSPHETYILRVLSFALIFAYLNHLTGYVIVVLKLQTKALFVAALALIFNLGLNVYLLPILGYQVAAHITVATEAFVLIGTTIILIKYFKKNKNPISHENI